MVDNSCASYFMFVAYAIVPLSQLLRIDLASPATLSDAHIATYNPMNGTFHDAEHVRNLTVSPKNGRYYSGSHGYSPENICCLHTPHYYGEITQTVPQRVQ
jgi:hypothetical protein